MKGKGTLQAQSLHLPLSNFLGKGNGRKKEVLLEHPNPIQRINPPLFSPKIGKSY
jgi:hypothetical protein